MTGYKQISYYVTHSIIKDLENHVLPWNKPWGEIGFPKNLVTGQYYNGMNFIFLMDAIELHSSSIFITQKQCEKLGGSIKEGAKPYQIVFNGYRRKKKFDRNQIELFKYNNTRSKHWKPPDLKKVYEIYNIVQTVGLDKQVEHYTKKYGHNKFNPIEDCEQVINNIRNKPKLFVSSVDAGALYLKEEDEIHIPPFDTFISREEYYATYFHELSHSTGHKSRLDRESLAKSSDGDYSARVAEELVAEFSTALLCGWCGIGTKTLNNNLGYINAWIGNMKQDSSYIFKIAATAHQVAEYILNPK